MLCHLPKYIDKCRILKNVNEEINKSWLGYYSQQK